MNEENEELNMQEANQEIVEEVSETEKLSIELAEQKDKFIRLYSDFDNFRKRTAKEKVELIQNASEGLIKDLLPIIDDFQRANEAFSNSSDVDALKEGVKLISDKFYKTLENKGLKSIDAKDLPFDVELHESVAQFPAGDDKKGIVVDELEKGYFLNDKVIRYSKVVVGN